MQLLQQADMAMYKAKQQGRNNFQWYTSDLNQRVCEHASLRNDLQKAIDANRILYFPTGFYKVTDKLTLRPDSILIGLHPAGRLGRPEEIAALARYLASDEAAFTTGQTYIIDGGWAN